jgi:hypothetical protein
MYNDIWISPKHGEPNTCLPTFWPGPSALTNSLNGFSWGNFNAPDQRLDND